MFTKSTNENWLTPFKRTVSGMLTVLHVESMDPPPTRYAAAVTGALTDQSMRMPRFVTVPDEARMLKDRCVPLPTAFEADRVQISSCHQLGLTNAACMALPGFPPATWVSVPEPLFVTVPSERRAPTVSPS